MNIVLCELEKELSHAEKKAWESLSKYKFQMFGYWAAIWVHLNRIGNFGRPNPWRALVHSAKNLLEEVRDGAGDDDEGGE